MKIMSLVAMTAAVVLSAGCSSGTPARSDDASPTDRVPASGSPDDSASDDSAGGTAEPGPTRQRGPLAVAMLRPTDIGPTYRLNQEELLGEDRGFTYMLGLCSSVNKVTESDRPGSSDSESAEFSDPGRDLPVSEMITQEASGFGPQAMRDLRTVIGQCRQFQTGDSRYSLAIVDAGFAGRDALLVELRVNGGDPGFYAFVRQGDLVAEVEFPDSMPRDDARAIAVRAWQRLCAATPTC